jgi:CRISPR system Cascade subunit CasD
MTDFHTYRTLKGKLPLCVMTRKDEIESDPEKVKTMTSFREYICDAFFTACLWKKKDDETISFDNIALALKKPRFTPYLGRKCCLPFPFGPEVMDAPTLRDAFSSYKIDSFCNRDGDDDDPKKVCWEKHPAPGISDSDVVNRHDVVVRRSAWIFGRRKEHAGYI